MPGRVLHLFLKPAHGQPMREVSHVTAIAGKGLEGDLAFGRSRRQILLVDQSTLAGFDLKPGQTRENISIAGLDLATLAAGTRLRIGEAVLEVTGECTPCDHMDAIRPGLTEAIRGHRGVLARVHTGGSISVSDVVLVEPAAAI